MIYAIMWLYFIAVMHHTFLWNIDLLTLELEVKSPGAEANPWDRDKFFCGDYYGLGGDFLNRQCALNIVIGQI